MLFVVSGARHIEMPFTTRPPADATIRTPWPTIGSIRDNCQAPQPRCGRIREIGAVQHSVLRGYFTGGHTADAERNRMADHRVWTVYTRPPQPDLRKVVSVFDEGR